MSQIRTGTVDVTNGSSTVIGTNTRWVGSVVPGSVFSIQGSWVSYQVAGVVSDTELTLTAPYGGDDAQSQFYFITTSFSPQFAFPIPEKGDVDITYLIRQALLKMDAQTSIIALGEHVAKAQAWANEDEDVEVEGGEYSSKHFAIKSAASANAAQTAQQQIAASESKAQDWAEKAEDTPVEPGKFSALHHAAKSQGHSNVAEDWATGSGEITPGKYSARHYAEASQTSADDASGFADNASGSAGNASNSADAAQASELLAGKWAGEAKNTPINPGEFSALHYAEVAKDWAETDPLVEVKPGEYSAKHHSARAAAWATRDEDAAVLPGQFSAKHHALKSEASAAAAAASAASLVGTLRFQGDVDLSGGSFPASPSDGDLWRVSVAGEISSVTYSEGEYVFFKTGDGWLKLGGAGGGGGGAALSPTIVSVSNSHALTAGDDGGGSLLDMGAGAQTISLPSLATVPDGFTHTVATSGLPSAHLAAYVDTDAVPDKIFYWGQLVDRHYLIGGGEAFQFVAVTQGAVRFWYCITVQQPAPGHFDVLTSYSHGSPAWNNTPTSWTAMVGNGISGPGSAMTSRVGLGIHTPVTGKYELQAIIHYNGAAGGGSNGVGWIGWALDGVVDQSLGFTAKMHWTGGIGSDTGTRGSIVFGPNRLIQPFFLTSTSALFYWPTNNKGRFTLTQR